MSTQSSTPAQNPIVLLQEQLLRLTDIYQAQQEQINLLRAQNEHLAQALQAIAEQPSPQEKPISARIEDLQMSFWSLVVLQVKFIPASFLAALFWLIVLFTIALIVSLVLGALGVAISTIVTLPR